MLVPEVGVKTDHIRTCFIRKILDHRFQRTRKRTRWDVM
jgi:hypothetical protein